MAPRPAFPAQPSAWHLCIDTPEKAFLFSEQPVASAKRAATGLSVVQFTAPAGAEDPPSSAPAGAAINNDPRTRWLRASRLPPATFRPRLRRARMCQTPTV